MRTVKVSDLKLNRVPFHSQLTPEQESLCRLTWEMIRDSEFKPSYEQWEYGFTLDLHPDNELKAWVQIGNTYRECMTTMEKNGTEPSLSDRKDIISLLCGLSISQGLPEQHDSLKRKISAIVNRRD
jgi:hypothetical protein